MLRRAWVVLGTTLLVIQALLLVSDVSPRRAVTESVVLVPSGAGRAGPGAALEATRLAVTYAAAIPSDAGVLQEAARRLHETPEEISRSIEVRNEPNTALLRIRFRADGESQALEGASAILSSLASAAPTARAVAGHSLLLVRPPRLVSEQAGAAGVVTIGLLLGLLLGLGLVVLIERADPRIDDADRLAWALRADATALRALFPGGAGALLERWRLTSKTPTPLVALVSGTAAIQPAMSAVGDQLRQALEADGVDDPVVLDALASPEDWASRVREHVDSADMVGLMVVGMPGKARYAEWAATVADVVVVAVQRGARQKEVRSVMQRLDLLADRWPDWGLLVVPGDLRGAVGGPPVRPRRLPALSRREKSGEVPAPRA